MKNDNVFVLWLSVVCDCVGGDLFVMGCCVVCDGLLCCLCLMLLLRFVWVCEWCISSQVCIEAGLSVCISDESSVCCVCVYI